MAAQGLPFCTQIISRQIIHFPLKKDTGIYYCTINAGNRHVFSSCNRNNKIK